MATKARIRRLVMEVEIPSEKDFESINQKARDFVNRNLLAEIQKIADELDPKVNYIIEAFQYFSGKKLFRKVIPEAINDYIDGGIKKINENLYELNCNPKWEAATFKLTSGGNWFNLKKSNVPTKVILTPNSVVCNERSQKKLNKSIAKIEFVTLENTTHMLPLEDIDGVGNEILSFL